MARAQAGDAAPAAAPAPEAVAPEAVAEGDVEVIVAVVITGSRNGVPWPAPGEKVTLPAAEAADYLRFGYVREVTAEA